LGYLVSEFITFNVTVAGNPHVGYKFTSECGGGVGIVDFSCQVGWFSPILDAHEGRKGVAKNNGLVSFNFVCCKLDGFEDGRCFSSVNGAFV